MPKAAPLQSNFLGGELSPLAQGRVDLPEYKRGLAQCTNYVPTVQGSLTRRPGTKYLGTTSSSNFARLLKFELSISQAYVIEMQAGFFRFWRNDALIGGGSPVTVANAFSGFTSTQLRQVRTVQADKTLYFFHPLVAPTKLVYTSDTVWTASTVNFTDGPWQPNGFDINFSNELSLPIGTAAYVSGTDYTFTAASTVNINAGSGFVSGDVGRTLRFTFTVQETVPAFQIYQIPGAASTGLGQIQFSNGSGSTYPLTISSVAVITSVSSSTVVHFTFITGQYPSTGLFPLVPDSWLLAMITTGQYPTHGCLHEGRLWMGGFPSFPRTVVASQTFSYENFAPTTYAAVSTDSSGLNFTLNSEDAQQELWMKPNEQGLLIGSVGDEWSLTPSSTGEAITPTNVNAKPVTFYGSSPNVDPIKVGKNILFPQRCQVKLREMGFAFDINGYRATDRTKLSDHLFNVNDTIVEMALQREPHEIVWVVTSSGQLMGMTHEEEDGVISTGWHEHFLGVSVGAQLGAIVESVCVIPSSDGSRDEVWLSVRRTVNSATVRYIETMQSFFGAPDALATAWFLDCALSYSNSTPFTVVSGLGYLQGETVTVFGDGAPRGTYVVNSSGQITLTESVKQVLVGYGYASRGQMLRLDSGAADGTSIGKIRRTTRVAFYLANTVNLSIGCATTANPNPTLTALTFRDQSMPGSTAVPLYTGIRLETFDADYDFDNMIVFEQVDPTPGTILAICPRLDTQDAD